MDRTVHSFGKKKHHRHFYERSAEPTTQTNGSLHLARIPAYAKPGCGSRGLLAWQTVLGRSKKQYFMVALGQRFLSARPWGQSWADCGLSIT